MNNYIYKYDEAIYINLTNRCDNNCTFCLRNTHSGVGEYDLRLEREPDAQDVIKELEKEPDIDKVVFCGFGEPTLRLEVMLEVAKYLKGRGARVRLNTNGQGSASAGYDIAPSLSGLIDKVSISLNAPDAALYQKLCRSVYGENAYENMLEFAKSCIANGIETVMTVVDIIGEDDIEKSRKIAESIGASFRVRHYFE